MTWNLPMNEMLLEAEPSCEVAAVGGPAPAPKPLPTIPTTVIEPPTGWELIDVRELWRFRELLFYLTWRDVKIRYKQTLLGAAWAVIQPFMMMVVFTIFLGRIARIDSGGLPYPVFVYAGLLPWTFFATSISTAANSIVGSPEVISKVYFPRLIVPFASVGAAMVDFLIAFTVLIGMMVYYGITPSLNILWLPVLVVLAILAALGVGTLLSALNVSYRDFKYTIPFMVQLWMFATPTVYMNLDAQADSTSSKRAVATATSEARAPGDGDAKDASNSDLASRQGTFRESLPTGVKAVLNLNPLTGLISFFRAATLGGPLPWRSLGYSTVVVVTFFLIGTSYFRRMETNFADVI